MVRQLFNSDTPNKAKSPHMGKVYPNSFGCGGKRQLGYCKSKALFNGCEFVVNLHELKCGSQLKEQTTDFLSFQLTSGENKRNPMQIWIPFSHMGRFCLIGCVNIPTPRLPTKVKGVGGTGEYVTAAYHHSWYITTAHRLRGTNSGLPIVIGTEEYIVAAYYHLWCITTTYRVRGPKNGLAGCDKIVATRHPRTKSKSAVGC
ncbi:hypothetical protein C8F04DRAFT_1181517 [Mycena alexandri]|uniref:Uncharacterized protein n=1 Tax=Mycena alexandri TaxID=1745969 RepID=A0AAD6T2P8_9AGAR|nr:hypothetical protein C8F04DRAFT_1181517 [Mycena alexandri]